MWLGCGYCPDNFIGYIDRCHLTGFDDNLRRQGAVAWAAVYFYGHTRDHDGWPTYIPDVEEYRGPFSELIVTSAIVDVLAFRRRNPDAKRGLRFLRRPELNKLVASYDDVPPSYGNKN